MLTPHLLPPAERTDAIWTRIKREEAEFEAATHGVGLYHRGYRFFPPYACGRCGDPISAAQFAFARSCGGCDVARGTSARLSIFDHRWFLNGRAELENPDDRYLIHPEFIHATDREQYPRLVRLQLKPRVVPQTRHRRRGW